MVKRRRLVNVDFSKLKDDKWKPKRTESDFVFKRRVRKCPAVIPLTSNEGETTLGNVQLENRDEHVASEPINDAQRKR